jgi:transposase
MRAGLTLNGGLAGCGGLGGREGEQLASLCGSPPVPVHSGQTQNRYRLNRGGDRQANAALWRIAIVRMGTDPRTSDYIAR